MAEWGRHLAYQWYCIYKLRVRVRVRVRVCIYIYTYTYMYPALKCWDWVHAWRAHIVRILPLDVGPVAQGRIEVSELPIAGGILELGSQQGEREARVVAA